MGSVILASLLSEITVTIYIGRWWHPDPEAELELGARKIPGGGLGKKRNQSKSDLERTKMFNIMKCGW
jgi:hypothetical protein